AVGTAPGHARGTALVRTLVRVGNLRAGDGARGRGGRTGRRGRLRPREVGAVGPPWPEDRRLRSLNHAGTPHRDMVAPAGGPRAAHTAGPREAVRPARDHAPGRRALAGRADGNRAVPDARAAGAAGADPPLHPVAAGAGRGGAA